MRNLVLLLASGHTVRVELRDGDLTGTLSVQLIRDFFVTMPAVGVVPFETVKTDFKTVLNPSGLLFAYVEDTTFPAMKPNGHEFAESNDFQRIDVLSPGDAGSAA